MHFTIWHSPNQWHQELNNYTMKKGEHKAVPYILSISPKKNEPFSLLCVQYHEKRFFYQIDIHSGLNT